MSRATPSPRRVTAEAGERSDRREIERAWWLALARSPSDERTRHRRRASGDAGKRVRRELPRQDRCTADDAEQLALASLCHVLLNTNEFIYVD